MSAFTLNQIVKILVQSNSKPNLTPWTYVNIWFLLLLHTHTFWMVPFRTMNTLPILSGKLYKIIAFNMTINKFLNLTFPVEKHNGKGYNM